MTCRYCARPLYLAGLCRGHYARVRSTGSPQADVPLRRHRRGWPAERRFWDCVCELPDTCLLWVAGVGDHGYGSFRGDEGKTVGAHRWAYEQYVGPIPTGLDLDHLCRNRACVNPAHLEPVTRRENARRGLKGVLTTHCPRGHEYTPENTHLRNGTWRECKACWGRKNAEAKERPA